jgi:hypothetical protein
MVDNSFIALTEQYRAPPKTAALDTALSRLEIADGARRDLRKPLKKWLAASVKYIRSDGRNSDILAFQASWDAIQESCRGQPHACVRALLHRLHGDICAAIETVPAACPRRQQCGLMNCIDKLFNDTPPRHGRLACNRHVKGE